MQYICTSIYYICIHDHKLAGGYNHIQYKNKLYPILYRQEISLFMIMTMVAIDIKVEMGQFFQENYECLVSKILNASPSYGQIVITMDTISPIAPVTNYHKLSPLKQHKLIIL